MLIPIEISARHIHLSASDLAVLFGTDHQLQSHLKLSQNGEFAATDSLTLLGPKNSLTARIVGPLRAQTQVELSLSDCRYLGLSAELRLSGDLTNTSGLTLVGPIGRLTLTSGLIIALRHLHLNTQIARELNLINGQIVRIQIFGPRAGILDQVFVRIQDHFQTALHLDSDEGNALGISPTNCQGKLLLD